LDNDDMVKQFLHRRCDMRELSRLERGVAVGSGVITILGGLAAFAIYMGLLPRSSESREGTELTTTELTTTQGERVEEAEEVAPVESGPSPPSEMTETARPQAPPSPPEFPVQARLQDGQQHVMLGGDLGVSAAFSEVASTPIATLRINHEGVHESNALLTAGDVFTVAVRGSRYRISVLDLNFEARELQVQVDKVD
jgi:hypothetical protein